MLWRGVDKQTQPSSKLEPGLYLPSKTLERHLLQSLSRQVSSSRQTWEGHLFYIKFRLFVIFTVFFRTCMLCQTSVGH